MAYDTKKLSLLVQDLGGGQSLWALHGSDSIATVLGAGYVSDATNKGMKLGDFVLATYGTLNTAVYTAPTTAAYGDANTVSTLSGTDLLVVSSISAGAATLVGRGSSDITDNSGGTAAAATGVVAALAKQQLIIPVGLYTGIANSNVYRVNVPFAFTLLSAGVRPTVAVTTGAKAATLTATVGGQAALTGGVIAMTSANQTPVGTRTNASAISGATATGTAGMAIEFTASSVTAFAEGAGNIECEVSNNDLANAIATLIKF